MPYITSIERIAKQEGRQEGLREGLLRGIEIALKLKFEAEAEDLFSEIAQIEDVETLKAIQTQMLTIESWEELQNLYLNAPDRH